MLFPVTPVWVTGNFGTGKSTVCEFLKSAEHLAFDAARTRDETAFLRGSAENEEEVLDLFDLVVRLVVDNETSAPKR